MNNLIQWVMELSLPFCPQFQLRWSNAFYYHSLWNVSLFHSVVWWWFLLRFVTLFIKLAKSFTIIFCHLSLFRSVVSSFFIQFSHTISQFAVHFPISCAVRLIFHSLGIILLNHTILKKCLNFLNIFYSNCLNGCKLISN